jgi:hypothetical protein
MVITGENELAHRMLSAMVINGFSVSRLSCPLEFRDQCRALNAAISSGYSGQCSQRWVQNGCPLAWANVECVIGLNDGFMAISHGEAGLISGTGCCSPIYLHHLISQVIDHLDGDAPR